MPVEVWIGLAVTLAILLAFMMLPARRSVDRTADEVAQIIRNFIDGKGDAWDWDDFENFSLADPELERIRQEALLAIILLPAALWLDVASTAKALLIMTVMLVLIVELLNSAVEAVVDRVSVELHPLAKRAKDIASAAVFLSLATVVMVWTLVLWDRYGN